MNYFTMNPFSKRHIGPNSAEKNEMLDVVGVSTINELIDRTIPSAIKLNRELNIDDAL